MINPETAYSLLESEERAAVDEYVQFAIAEQNRLRERIVHALYKPIPNEFIRRSKSALYKPLLRAAVNEKLKEAADEQDLSPSRVIQEHASIAFSNMNDYVACGNYGDIVIKDINQLSPEKQAAIKSIEVKPGVYGLTSKLTLHDKHTSLKALGEMMGIVASDTPPVLADYVKPPKALETVDDVPEDVYAKMLV